MTVSSECSRTHRSSTRPRHIPFIIFARADFFATFRATIVEVLDWPIFVKMWYMYLARCARAQYMDSSEMKHPFSIYRPLFRADDKKSPGTILKSWHWSFCSRWVRKYQRSAAWLVVCLCRMSLPCARWRLPGQTSLWRRATAYRANTPTCTGTRCLGVDPRFPGRRNLCALDDPFWTITSRLRRRTRGWKLGVNLRCMALASSTSDSGSTCLARWPSTTKTWILAGIRCTLSSGSKWSRRTPCRSACAWR